MAFKHAVLGCAFALLLGASSAAAAGPRVRVVAPSAPAAVDEATRVAFRDVVRERVAEAELQSEREYVLRPALVQLRRFLEEGKRTPTLACVVDIAVSDGHGVLIATVRGYAKTLNAPPREVLEAATDSALRQLAPVLVAAR